MALMIKGTDDKLLRLDFLSLFASEIGSEIFGLAYLMHGETDWNKPITAEDEENFRLSDPEMFACYGSMANCVDDQRSQGWQSALSGARHFYREAAEWHEQNSRYAGTVTPLRVTPFIELSKVERLAGLTAYAEYLHRQGSTRALTRLAHIAQL